MDRETILKHSKSIRLKGVILEDFINVIGEFCERKGFPQHINGLVQILQTPIIGQEAMNLLLEEFEKEFKLIRLIKLETNQIIDIW